MFKKSLSLLEVVLAMVMLGMIVLAATSLDVASVEFFKSSNRKVEVINEVSLVMNHVEKSAISAHGWINNPGFGIMSGGDGIWFRLDGSRPPSPSDYTDDDYVFYRFDSGTNQIEYCKANSMISFSSACPGQSQILSNRIETCTFSYPADSVVVQAEITGIYDPAGPAADERENPHVQMRSMFFLGSHSFR